MGILNENENFLEIVCTMASGEKFREIVIVDEDEFEESEVINIIKDKEYYFFKSEDGTIIYDTKYVESINLVGLFDEETAIKRKEDRKREKEQKQQALESIEKNQNKMHELMKEFREKNL
ncbi:hypothetical protein BU036_10835 [Staphylococcus simulans]|uniref:hypothetical protein n=1 Tax=Staphylococcus simulans TaxID=1286 RepID=UPI000D0235AD|nr:hypothetical protein [Staphylococcus simulans]PTI99597.1 hypothetical protein BU048_06175 [Staphylococcus simulans]PTJ07748.1 hypothetical protein BU042_04250 [Staphylococcus simulans]RIN48542.1 hypothetical protein BU036_10835 [Staphylococcus simulans]